MSGPKRTVLITGCSKGGIGDALAREFHRRGLRVFATARNLEKVRHLQESGIEVLQLDVVDQDSIRNAVDQVSKFTNGTLHILVNNSGSGYQMPLLDADLDEARRLFDVNVWGVLAMCQAFAPLLAAATTKGTPSRILNIGSVVARSYLPWQGVYNASKAALWMLNDNLRIELAPFGIEALQVITGGIQTNFFANTTGTKLPANSMYGPVRDIIEADVAGEASTKQQSVTPDAYAKAVVKNTLSRRPTKNVWVGGKASLAWLGATFGPVAITDWFITHLLGWHMGGLKERLTAARKTSGT
ncbi:putative short-chain dehydrogenase/reductase [Xylariaceae sp. FL0662B]|nr:putative short-chain dehydrogenase/reductase [Xylariaceae sp. FL0662B]